MRSPTRSRGAALFDSLSDLIRPWESLDRIYEEGLVAGWATSKRWRGFGDAQRQARELISGPSLGAKAEILSFNRIQPLAVPDLTGHNTLRRHLYLLGLLDIPLCRRCGVREETSAHILCECEVLASLKHTYLGSFFLEPEDIKSISLGAICNSINLRCSHDSTWRTKGPLLRPRCIGTVRPRTQVQSVCHWQHILSFFNIILKMLVILALFNEALNISLHVSRNEMMVWIGMSGREGRRRERVTRILLRESEVKQVNYW